MAMTDATEGYDDASKPAGRPVRPVGAWVVAGFLVFATLTMWILVAVIFHARS